MIVVKLLSDCGVELLVQWELVVVFAAECLWQGSHDGIMMECAAANLEVDLGTVSWSHTSPG